MLVLRVPSDSLEESHRKRIKKVSTIKESVDDSDPLKIPKRDKVYLNKHTHAHAKKFTYDGPQINLDYHPWPTI